MQWPDSPEGWAFLTLLFSSLTTGGIWKAAAWWFGRKDAAAVVERAEQTAVWERYITHLELKEAQANEKLDASIAGMGKLTEATNELASISRPMLEEIRRIQESLRDLQRRP